MTDRSSEVTDLLGFWTWDSHRDGVRAVDLLESMSDRDFEDTIRAMSASGSVIRLFSRLHRVDVVRLLQLVASKSARPTWEALFTAEPFLDLGPENSLLVFGAALIPGLGAPGPLASAADIAAATGPVGGPFSGSGATGLLPSRAPISASETATLIYQYRAARFHGLSIDTLKYTRTSGYEMLYDWSNPVKGALVGPGSWLGSVSLVDRARQARVLLQRPISTEFRSAHGTPLPTRVQVIRAAAALHRLTPEVVSAIILAEQRDQSQREDAADWLEGAGSQSASIGLGQLTVRTATREGVFADSLSSPSGIAGRRRADRRDLTMISSDETNIFGVARYIRRVATIGAGTSIAALPNTAAWLGPIDLARYAGDAGTWTRDHVRLLGSEYTSRPFDDVLVEGWGVFGGRRTTTWCARRCSDLRRAGHAFSSAGRSLHGAVVGHGLQGLEVGDAPARILSATAAAHPQRASVRHQSAFERARPGLVVPVPRRGHARCRREDDIPRELPRLGGGRGGARVRGGLDADGAGMACRSSLVDARRAGGLRDARAARHLHRQTAHPHGQGSTLPSGIVPRALEEERRKDSEPQHDCYAHRDGRRPTRLPRGAAIHPA